MMKESASIICYEVKDWDLHFENGESRRYKSLTWVPVKNKHDGKSYRRVSKLPNGVQVFCAWSLIIQVASKMPTRGVLRDEDGPITTADLADMTGFPENIFEMAFKVLSEPRIGWLVESNLREAAGISADARQNPVYRLDETRQEQTGKQAGAGSGVLAMVETRINELYKREVGDAWTYAEQTALVDVCRRKGVWDELDHILAWRRQMQPDDRKRFFPQTVHSLLSRWTEALDKARVQCPIKKPAQSVATKVQPKGPTSDELRQSIDWLNQHDPKSPHIQRYQKQLEEMSK